MGRSRRLSGARHWGVDDRDTVDYGDREDYGGYGDYPPAANKPVDAKPVAKEAVAIAEEKLVEKLEAVVLADPKPIETEAVDVEDAKPIENEAGVVADAKPVENEAVVDVGDAKPIETEAVAVEEAVPAATRRPLTVAEREQLRLSGIKRNKEIVCLERVRGRMVDITAGLELHTGVFSRVEQNKLVEMVREFQAKGRRGELKERTYSEPRKWMRGKGRVTLQFGCCYNYAVDKNGNPPGILREGAAVDSMPPLLRSTIKRLVRWHVVPPTCVPDSCIINMYEEGDCIPPHIDHHDFLRPFCTLSLLSECKIIFGANLEILGPGDFGGKLSLPLPVGSVLVLNGNGADVAKHAVPAVPTERISITFRKMDPSKVPSGFQIDRDLQNLRPITLTSSESSEKEADE